MKIEKQDHKSNQPKISIANAASFLGVTPQAVHKQLKNKRLSCKKAGNKSYITHNIAKDLFNIPFKKRKIVGQIVKGGTGKTTTIDNISSCANAYGARVLLIDADPQGNLTDVNNIDAENYPILIDVIKGDATIEDCIIPVSEGLDLIASRIENVILDNEIVNKRLPLDKLYGNLLSSIERNYDFIFIDCPPTMGQAVTAASLYADVVIAPLNPDKFSAKGLKILQQEIETLNSTYHKSVTYRVYLNKFSSKTILSDKAIVSLISDPELEGKVLSTTIQYTQEIPNSSDSNRNLFKTLKKSIVREDFDRLARELLDIYPAQSYQEESITEKSGVQEKEFA